MKVVFVAHNEGRLRHFDGAIRMLAERGHTISVATREEIRTPPELDHPRVKMLVGPDRRRDAWQDFVKPLRSARDYARYLGPRYASARLVRWQAARRAPDRFTRWCESRPWVTRHWRILQLALRIAEDVVPSDPAFEAFLQHERPDVVLVTPLVQHGSYQTDYVKSAHRLGLPVGLPVFSWDNLSTQGVIRILPDRVLVWNDIQRWEAVALHGVPAERVVITGAPRFDEFFAMAPRTTREEFCEWGGLDSTRPFILYVGSSPFVAHREPDFVQRWAREIRKSADPTLKSCGVLIRPHPGGTEPWRGEVVPNVALHHDPHKLNADPELYDSIYHAAIVVGLNTSAMIQAGVLGKPVHTIVVPQFEGQEGLLPFAYLVHACGGLVTVAHDFEQHRQQLAEALRSDASGRERSLRFVEGFVRPHGLDVPATPILVREIERLAEIRKCAGRRAPLWHAPVRWALRRWIHGRLSAPAARPESPASRQAAAGPGGGPDREVAASGRGSSPRSGALPGRVLAERVARRLDRPGSTEAADVVAQITASLAASADAGRHRTKRSDYERYEISLRLPPGAAERWFRPCKVEPYAIGWIEALLRPGDVLYDIGANVGTYSLIAAKFSRGDASIFSIEPRFSSFARLCQNVVLNQCDESITPLPIALWSESSPVGARRAAPGWSSGASISGRDSSEATPTCRFDDLVRRFDLPPPSHIRLDVGGAELRVLQGAVDALNDPRLQSLLVQVQDFTAPTTKEAEICRVLASKGFRLRSEHQADHRPGTAPYCVFTRA